MDTSKIIRGVVSNGRYTVTAPIVKEDYGLYLKIEGLELPSTYEVDFSNDEHNGTSVTMIGNADGVLIPRQFIDSGKDVFAFLYHVGANYGRTVYKFRIPNKVRPDRTNEQPTPEEQSIIDQTIAALNSAVTQTAQDKADADASAQASAESAQASGESALSASNSALSSGEYASNALGYAESASASATASAQSASQSAQIKTDIEGYVSTAQTAAQTATDKAAQASQSATNASNSATTASTKAGEASASATTASNKASEASGYATTASNKATEASGYANTASQKASDAESAKTAAQTAHGLAEQAQTGAETAQGKAEDAQEAAEDAAASVSASAAQIATNTSDITALKEGLTNVNDNLKGVENQIYFYTERVASASPTGWRLNENDGLCSSDSSYKLVKFPVIVGEIIKVVSNDRFQFQTTASVPSSGENNRVGRTYGQGEYIFTVPAGTTYLIMSALIDGGVAKSYSANKVLDDIKQNTKNILEITQPKKQGSKTVLLDLGQDTTFESGVVFSCMFNNATTDNVIRAIIDLRESNGTHHYCTYNSLYDSNGKHLTTSAQTGRFSSKGFPAYSSSITFRYVDVYYSETNTPSGTLSDFMLEIGTEPSYGYLKPISAIDSVARLDIEQIKGSEIPDYWESPLNTAEQTILSNRLGIESGDEFIFITDQHWASNAQKSSKLIDRLMEDLSINFIVNGGDIVNTHNATKMGAVNEIVDYYKSFKHRHRILSTIGNHDLNNNNNPDSSLHLSPQELYWFMIKPEETWIDTDNSAYVNVYNNNSQKIRYIQFYHCYDSGFIQSVADALVAKMQSTPSDWTIVLISHAYWNGTNPSSSATQYANVILQTMDSITAKVALWLVGHNHTDSNTTITSSGGKSLLIVGTTTDAVGQNPSTPVMTIGTATEQAFDVVQIDTNLQKIYMTRLGAGSDREFAY